MDDYPHQFSGGMRQRAMIAMALVCNPELLIADEPTTALDVTVQAQILDLLKDLQQEFGSAIILITHDLGVVANIADDLLVMYAGRAVERGTVKEVLRPPQHPYTWGLLGSMPRLSLGRRRAAAPDPRHPAEPAQPAVRLRLPPPLRLRRARSAAPAAPTSGPLLPSWARGAACHLTRRAEADPLHRADQAPAGLGSYTHGRRTSPSRRPATPRPPRASRCSPPRA